MITTGTGCDFCVCTDCIVLWGTLYSEMFAKFTNSQSKGHDYSYQRVYLNKDDKRISFALLLRSSTSLILRKRKGERNKERIRKDV